VSSVGISVISLKLHVADVFSLDELPESEPLLLPERPIVYVTIEKEEGIVTEVDPSGNVHVTVDVTTVVGELFIHGDMPSP
jgi:hypothetical protein